MHYDVVIRNGTIIDGSGANAYDADVAVKDGLIARIGRLDCTADEEVDAQGMLVTPGFIDVHTHLDGYVTWGETFSPSSSQGVTTVLFGNCGVGFAPCRPEDREKMIRLMEGVEDIPGVVLTEGLPWNWKSFPEFLDRLAERNYDIDIAALFPHGPLRVYVMGDRAVDREAATQDDIDAMVQLTREALDAGAFGIASSRSINHRASDGGHTPSLMAKQTEFVELARAVGAHGLGLVQLISDFEDTDAEFDLIRRMADVSRRPTTFTLVQLHQAPSRWRNVLERMSRANGEGTRMSGQVLGRPMGLMLGLEVSFSPFSLCPRVQAMSHMPFEQRLAAFRDPAVRQEILEEFEVPVEHRKAEIARAFEGKTVDLGSIVTAITDFSNMYALGDPPQYEPPAGTSIAAIADHAGRSAADVAYDALLEQNGRGLIYVPALNFSDRNLDIVREMIVHEGTVPGLSDAGAHCSLICDATAGTHLLTHWGRDRAQGRIPLPLLVNKLTHRGASLMGLMDRGLIREGLRADINVIDFDRLRLHPPKVVYDLPAGGRRLTQDAEGFVLTMVRGVPTYRNGEFTGRLPGKLLRSGVASIARTMQTTS